MTEGATPPMTPKPLDEPLFDNPRRCSYCGVKGGHLRNCGNPILQRIAADHRRMKKDSQ